MDNKNQQIQNTVNMMAECLRDNANAHLLTVLVGDGATSADFERVMADLRSEIRKEEGM